MKGLRRASQLAVNKLKEVAISTNEGNRRDTLAKLASTAMTNKPIKRNTPFFTKMVVDAVLSLGECLEGKPAQSLKEKHRTVMRGT